VNKKGGGKVTQEEVKVSNIDKEITMIILKKTWEFVIGKK
jgi:hypothetical protein